MQEIMEYLEEKAPLIDKAISKYFPRKMSAEYMEWAFGKPRYTYDTGTADKALAEPVWDFLDRGGKRWRPALLLLVAEALGADAEKIMDFAAVPELAHNGSIMVDDIEDSSELRRGKPCTHKVFGVDVAINAGNFMYFLPSLVFIKNRDRFSPEKLVEAYSTFLQEMINIHIGQGMDIWWHKGGAGTVTEEQYCQMCAYKTGTLARMSAKLAAVLAGGSPEQVEKIGRFAEALGVAFQIQDDVLSASGSDFAKRKGFGDDITEGKRSLMVIHALGRADAKDRDRLTEILGMHTRDQGLIEEAIGILKKYGSIAYAKEFARKLMSQAWEEADPMLPEGRAKGLLKSFADYLINRDI